MGNCMLFFTIMVLVVAFQEGQGILCNQCNDIELPGLIDEINKCPSSYFLGVTLKQKPVACDHGCFLTRSISNDGTIATVRGCNLDEDLAVGCDVEPTPNGEIHHCRCNGILCNSGVSLAPIGTFNMSAVIILTISLFIYRTL